MKRNTALLLTFLTCSVANARPVFDIEDRVLELELFDVYDVDPPIEQPNGTWCMSYETHDMLKLLLLHYYRMPTLLHQALKINDGLWRTVLRASLNIARAEGHVAIAEVAADDGEQWPVWQLGLVFAAVLVVGLASGIGLGVMASR